ncbi:MAG TPA: TlpA disulfide reductase family protein [Pyrinomonadaceae bacterium]|nr:TlpA disulfide reductase family protein [Pyrinomonadaceae bacterium]
MRKTFLLILLVAMFAVGAAAQSGRRGMTRPPPPPPEKLSEPPIVLPAERASVASAELTVLPESILKRQLKALDNGTFSLADFSGKIVVVNLEASWCGPCRREVPEYEKVRQEFAGRGVEFVGLTTEDPRTSSDRVKQFARDFNFGFRLGWADRETAVALMNGRNAIPQTLIIAPDGRIISHWRGYSPRQGGSQLRATLEHALAEASPSPQN